MKIEFAKKKDYLEKYPDETNHMDMSDDKESDERYQIDKKLLIKSD